MLANTNKSCLFLAGVEEEVFNSICQFLQYTIRALPMRYLGVPLITSKLKKEDCNELVQKIGSRILSWTSKFLPYTNRLQLIQFVLAGIRPKLLGGHVHPS